MAAVAGELHVGRGLARRRTQGLDDLQARLVDDVNGVPIRSEEHVDPGVGRVFVAAQEETGAKRLDRLDYLSALQVDDTDQAVLDVGRRHDPPTVAQPGDPGA